MPDLLMHLGEMVDQVSARLLCVSSFVSDI